MGREREETDRQTETDRHPEIDREMEVDTDTHTLKETDLTGRQRER